MRAITFMGSGCLQQIRRDWVPCMHQQSSSGRDQRPRFSRPAPRSPVAPNPQRHRPPTKVGTGSNKAAWWLCKLGHEWKATVERRSRGSKCPPVCGGWQVLAGFNDLAARSPLIASQWHPTKNTTTPSQVGNGTPPSKPGGSAKSDTNGARPSTAERRRARAAHSAQGKPYSLDSTTYKQHVPTSPENGIPPETHSPPQPTSHPAAAKRFGGPAVPAMNGNQQLSIAAAAAMDAPSVLTEQCSQDTTTSQQ